MVAAVHVHREHLECIAKSMLMIAHKMHAITTEHVLIKLAAMIVYAHQDLLVHDVKVISTNVFPIRARVKEHWLVYNW